MTEHETFLKRMEQAGAGKLKPRKRDRLSLFVEKLFDSGPATVDPLTKPVTIAEVKAAQKLWAESIASISKVYLDGGDYVAAAGEAAGKLYGYGHGPVLFKPTKATKHPFRATGEEAMSYFVGADAMKNDEFKGEDAGFAINGGSGWKVGCSGARILD